MGVLQRGMRSDPEKFDLSTEIMVALKAVSEHEIGPFHPSPWLCINLDDYRVGRAYPYRGEHRIVPITPDFGMMQDIDEAVMGDAGTEV
jgi:hypothetical protein